MAVSNQAVADWFKANPGLDDKAIVQTMNEFNVSPQQLAASIGGNADEYAKRYDAAMGVPSATVVTKSVDSTVKAPQEVPSGFDVLKQPEIPVIEKTKPLLSPYTYDPKYSTLAPKPETVNYVAKTNDDVETVENRLSGLLNANSDYLKRAQSLSAMNSNSRGLLNSSMASQAGTAAAIDAALPIATSDANAINTQNLANLGYENSALEFNANATNQFSLAAYNAQNQNNQFNAQQFNDSAKQNAATINDFLLTGYGTETDLMKFKEELQLKSDQFDAQLAQDNEILSKQIGAQMFSELSQTYLKGIQDIQTSSVYATAEEKQAAMDEFMASYLPILSGAEAVSGADGMFKTNIDYITGSSAS